MPVDSPINNFARAVGDRIHRKKVAGPDAVGFDFVTLLMFLVPLIIDIVKMIRECNPTPEDAGTVVRAPGAWSRWRLWWAIGRRSADLPVGLTRREVYDAILAQAQVTLNGEVAGAIAALPPDDPTV